MAHTAPSGALDLGDELLTLLLDSALALSVAPRLSL